MNLVYKTRVELIRFAKTFPFVLCFIVLISLSETILSLACNRFSLYDGSIIPYTPFSWLTAQFYEISIYTFIIALILSIAFETCAWNKASVFYLLLLILQRQYFARIELYPEYICIVCIINIVVSTFLVYKGIRIVIKKQGSRN